MKGVDYSDKSEWGVFNLADIRLEMFFINNE